MVLGVRYLLVLNSWNIYIRVQISVDCLNECMIFSLSFLGMNIYPVFWVLRHKASHTYNTVYENKIGHPLKVSQWELKEYKILAQCCLHVNWCLLGKILVWLQNGRKTVFLWSCFLGNLSCMSEYVCKNYWGVKHRADEMRNSSVFTRVYQKSWSFEIISLPIFVVLREKNMARWVSLWK